MVYGTDLLLGFLGLSVIMLYPKASLKIPFNLLLVRTGAGSLNANTAYSAVNAQSQLINGVF